MLSCVISCLLCSLTKPILFSACGSCPSVVGEVARLFFRGRLWCLSVTQQQSGHALLLCSAGLNAKPWQRLSNCNALGTALFTHFTKPGAPCPEQNYPATNFRNCSLLRCLNCLGVFIKSLLLCTQKSRPKGCFHLKWEDIDAGTAVLYVPFEWHEHHVAEPKGCVSNRILLCLEASHHVCIK